MAPPLDFSGVIPPEFSTQIIEEAVQASAVLTLAQLMPMGTTITTMPIPSTLPSASFVTGAGARKPWTDIALAPVSLHAEEVAAVTAIPDQFLEDSSINLWNWVRPRIAEAIAIALDNAVLWGAGAPATFPAGGVNALAQSIAPNAIDSVATVNDAMAAVEAQGLEVDGHAADITVRSVLRGVRTTTNELLLGTMQMGDVEVPTMYGVPITYTPFAQVPGTRTDAACGTTSGSPTVTDAAITANDLGKSVSGAGVPAGAYITAVTAGTSFTMNANATATASVSLTIGHSTDYFTGDWDQLIIGVRQDIRYSMDPSGVVADSTGKVLISGFQDNQTPLKVWARFGAVIVKPVTHRVPGGANPFAKAALKAKVTPTEVETQPASSGSGSGRSTAKA